MRRARSRSGRSMSAQPPPGQGTVSAASPSAPDERLDAATKDLKRRLLDKRHQFRLALCGHKAIEAGAVCLLLMVQGNLAMVTPAHFEIAAKTGLLAVSPALGVTFTRYARHFANRWISSIFLGICTFFADVAIHESHYPGKLTEAALTGLGAFAFSLLISYTPIGKHIDRLGEPFRLASPPRKEG